MTLHAQPEITPFFDTEKEQRRSNGVILLSGSGSNAVEILEHQLRMAKKYGQSPYRIVALVSDTTLRKNEDDEGCRAELIVDAWNKKHDANVGCLFWCDIDKWYQQEGMDFKAKNDPAIPKNHRLKLREMYDMGTKDMLDEFCQERGIRIDFMAAAGYMSKMTGPLLNYALGVNVHPANLAITCIDDKTGKTIRKYRGDHAVRDAILAGEKRINASTHLLEPEVDMGRLLMISEPLNVIISSLADEINLDRLTAKQMRHAPEVAKEVEGYNQDRLKEAGDWIIFPKTLEYIALGRFGTAPNGDIYHKNDEGVWTKGEIRLG